MCNVFTLDMMDALRIFAEKVSKWEMIQSVSSNAYGDFLIKSENKTWKVDCTTWKLYRLENPGYHAEWVEV